MATYTNTGLVKFAKEMLALGDDTLYVYGSFGRTLTESLINQKAIQYAYNFPRKSLYKKIMDSKGTEYAFDCVGLIKAYYWGWNGGKTDYKASQDKSANGMYSAAKVKGKISTMPEIPGLLVQMSGHIGIYIGNGYVIECTPTKSFAKQSHGAGGVCKTKLKDRKWTHWLECPYITYEEVEENDSFLPGKGYWGYGDKHENVGKISAFMYRTFPAYTPKAALGNYYGPKVKASIKEFQKRTGLEQDGCVGPKTLAKLRSFGFEY